VVARGVGGSGPLAYEGAVGGVRADAGEKAMTLQEARELFSLRRYWNRIKRMEPPPILNPFIYFGGVDICEPHDPQESDYRKRKSAAHTTIAVRGTVARIHR
jgi:hypothetical protein